MSGTDANQASHQLDALSFPLWGSRLIEASAGTGKTWTIAALYLRLVLGHGAEQGFERPLMPPDILVMTFTRAATRELSDRIRARLVDAVRCFRGEAEPQAHDGFLRDLRHAFAPGEERERAAWRLEMAAQSMDDAAIHTIDAWCQRMLREHAFDSGNLFDETLEPDETQRRTEAVQDYWRQQCYPLTGEQLELALKTWPQVGALLADMQGLLRESVVFEAPPISLGECMDQVVSAQKQQLQALAQGWEDKAQRLEDWLDGQLAQNKSAWNGAKLKAANYKNWLQALRAWTQAPHKGLAAQLKTGATRLLPQGLDDARKGDVAVELPPESAQLADLLAALETLPDIRSTLRLHAAAHVSQRLQWLKSRAGTFGFADMLQRLDKALAADNGAQLRQRILEQYPLALIDEFQDTSPLQYSLFDRIYRTADNDPHSGLLLIGDPKQSIYGFRGADIYSYLQAREATAGRHYVLGTNYRSTRQLVDAVNHWFARAEQRPGEAAFMFRNGCRNPLPFEPVAAQGRSEQLRTRSGPMPAMTLALGAGCSDDGGAEPLSGQDMLRSFAAHCAEQIVDWLGDAQAGFEDVGGSFRRLRPADIAVLVRSGKEAAAIRRELQARAVASVYLSDQDSVFAGDEAHDLVYWLRAVAAPRDAMAVRAGLATRLLGLSLDELAWLAANEQAFDEHSELLHELQGIWQRQGVLAMLRQTLFRLDLPARWLRLDMGGERRLTNYLHLAELLQSAGARLEGEQALIRWFQAQIDEPGAASDAQIVRLESDADLVKIVTVHKSKGLEYALVCLPFASSFRPLERARTPFLSLPAQAHGRPGRELVLNYDDAQLQQADRERLREDLRLFYVALTRARHALWMGLAPLKRGNAKACMNEKGAAGYLLAGTEPRSAEAWLDAARQLCADVGQEQVMVCCDLTQKTLTGRPWEPAEEAEPLQEAQVYAGHFDTRWGIGSFSSLVRAMGGAGPASAPGLPVLAVADQRPAGDESGLDEALEPMPVQAACTSGVAVWHRFLRGPVVGNFVHDQLEWLASEGFELPEDGEGLLAQRLLKRCERAGRGEQGSDLLSWLTAVVHAPLPPLDASLAGLDRILPEMEFWLPARQLSARRIDQLCRRFILPGRERPQLPARALHGMLMGFADLVLHHQGRYWVLDYKTNQLGPGASSYTPDALAQAMLDHRYDVQAALYLLALHRLLRSRLGQAYAPGRDLGGALYYFLRGIDGPAQGMHWLEPEPALLQALDELLDQPLESSQPEDEQDWEIAP
ncbi:exodeoxyribonuclease V subunit beta [Comamonas composti]|uniref:exodeoxyribonuclease V subunit beta n=1 Tax=Comamonas composti TaxID=408558 RepID=UPI000406E2D6|nr:exodeoxyribonuclease V subunit beta [Comamonas composti]